MGQPDKQCSGFLGHDLCAEHPGFEDTEPYCEACGSHFGLRCEGCGRDFDSVWNELKDVTEHLHEKGV